MNQKNQVNLVNQVKEGNNHILFGHGEMEKENYSWMIKKVGNGFYSCLRKWNDSPQVLSLCLKQGFLSWEGYLFSQISFQHGEHWGTLGHQ